MRFVLNNRLRTLHAAELAPHVSELALPGVISGHYIIEHTTHIVDIKHKEVAADKP